MLKPNPKPHRIPRGKALPRSDEALVGLSQFNRSDIEHARALVEKHAPKPYAMVLDPKTEEEA